MSEPGQINWAYIFARFAEARNWTPDQVGELTLRQVKILAMKIDGLDGVESIGRVFVTGAARKFMEPARKKAISNLIEGKRWEAQ